MHCSTPASKMQTYMFRLLISADSQRAVGLLEPALLSTARAATAAVVNDAVRSQQQRQQQQQQQQHLSESLLKQAQQQQRPGWGRQPDLLALQPQHWARLHTAAAGGGGSSAAGSSRTSTSSSQAAEQSKAITRLLRDASSIGQLQSIVEQHGSAFNAINVAAALTRASHILSGNQQQQQQHGEARAALPPAAAAGQQQTSTEGSGQQEQRLLQDLSSLCRQRLHLATPRELTSVMLACSKLSLFEPTLWASTLAALLQQPESINSQDASSAAYALATAAVANGGSVRGVGRQQVTDALLTLTSKVHSFAVDSSSSSSSNSSSSRGKGGASVAAQAISNLLWSLARLEVQPPLHELEGLLQGLADPRVLASASPLAIVNSLWALSELQHLSSWGRNSDTAAAGVVRGNLGSMQAASNGTGKGSKQQQQQQQLLRIIPAVLLSEQQLVLLAKSSSQGVSNAVLALSRFATGPQPHLLEVPAAQSCIRQLLADATAGKSLARWNAQDVGNAVYAAAQVGVVEPGFMQAVMAAAPAWLPEAGPATVAQVALGLARLKLRHESEFLEALVLRGKQLLLQHDHHHQQTSPEQPSSSSSSSSSSNGSDEAPTGRGGQGAAAAGAADVGVYVSQQEQHMCECLATDLSWSIAVLNQGHLAKDIAQLIRASGIKQESSLHPKNARRLWVVHAWLAKHKLAGGHGLQRLLTEQQLAFCAAASRHTHRLTPPPGAVVQG